MTFTAANWFTPQTVTVDAVNDGDIEGDHAGSIDFTVTSTDLDYNGIPVSSLSADVVDNDSENHAVVINEIHNDPSSSALSGDANGDGVFDVSDDEFIEIVNTGSDAIDISGWIVRDENPGTRHEFPAGTVLGAGQGIVVFGGIEDGQTLGTFGNSLAQLASSGGLGFSGEDSAFFPTAVKQSISTPGRLMMARS